MPLIRRDAVSAPASPLDLGALAAALARGSAEERWHAARALADLPGGLDVVAAALPAESDIRVREAMFTGIARSAAPQGVDLLVSLLRAQDASLRTGALDALAAMPPLPGYRLDELLRDPDADFRLLACELVRGLASEEATALLCGALERDPEENVCAAAVTVLAEIGEPQALPALQRCAGRFPSSPFLIFAIDMAVKRIGSFSAAGREA